MSVLLSQNYGNKQIKNFLDALFGGKKAEKAKKSGKTSLESKRGSIADELMISPQNRLRSVILEYKQSLSSSLNLSLRLKADKPISDSSMQNKLFRQADSLLRFISRNNEEYQQLKNSFEEMFNNALGNFKDIPTEDEISGINVENLSVTLKETEAEVSVKKGDFTQRLKYSSYELSMSFTKVAVGSHSEDKSIAASFADSISALFGRASRGEEVVAETSVSSSSSSYTRLKELSLKGCDPIVLDLDGEGIKLTKASQGAKFDINADGKVDNTAWVAGNTALLVYDKNGNNRIDNGSELFGDQNGAANGFIELAKYDYNGDGKIDCRDAIYKNLKLYRDLNGDGKISKDEFSSLKDTGIKALFLNCTQCSEDINGNSIILNGSFQRENGTIGRMADAIFKYSEL